MLTISRRVEDDATWGERVSVCVRAGISCKANKEQDSVTFSGIRTHATVTCLSSETGTQLQDFTITHKTKHEPESREQRQWNSLCPDLSSAF